MTVYRGVGTAGSGAIADYVETSDLADTSTVSLGDAMVGGKRTLANCVAFTLHGFGENRALNLRTDFGVIGDGSDETTAIANAAASGTTVLVPDPDSVYGVSGTLTFSNGTKFVSIGDYPLIRQLSASTAELVSLDNLSDVALVGLKLDGNKAVTPSSLMISMNGSTRCKLLDCKVVNAPGTSGGCLLITGAASYNEVVGCDFTDAEGTAICLSGSGAQHNKISGNHITDAVYFGIRLGESANQNEISFNRTTSNGLELIGITQNCHQNLVLGNHAEGTGDNGVSISGYRNVIVGNVCIGNANAGIHVWGSFNTVTGNTCLNNNQSVGTWAGIGVSSNYGGAGQFNTVTGNVCDDDQGSPTQYNGVRIAGLGNAVWAGTTAFAAGAYCYYGLNIYYTSAGGTTGGTPPTHTSGSASDGAVTWTYIRSYLTAAGAYYNIVAGNVVPRYSSADYVDTSNWTDNVLISQSKTDNRSSGVDHRLGVGSLGAIYFNFAGTDKLRCTSSELRPESDAGLTLGLTNRRWANIHTQYVYTGASGATTQVLGSRVTGFTTAAGSGNKDASGINTGTITATDGNVQALAAWVKSLHDALASHGIIGS